MTAQTMSFHYELTCKGFSAEKAHYLVTLQNDLCCFIRLTFTLSLKLSFYNTRYNCFYNNNVIVQHDLTSAHYDNNHSIIH